MKTYFLFVVAVVCCLLPLSSSAASFDDDKLQKSLDAYMNFKAALLQYVDHNDYNNATALIQALRESGLSHQVKFHRSSSSTSSPSTTPKISIQSNNNHRSSPSSPSTTFHPVVQMHGMGDYAGAYSTLGDFISLQLNGSYVTSIALGDNIISDILNTFLMTMDHEVDTFAAAVAKDEKLANGFNAIGYSQGNLIIRGYIERYNNPPVFNWVSVHGPLSGVAGFPDCSMSSILCELFDDLLGDLAYDALFQEILAQANYYRDPLRIPEYLTGDTFLATINNEKTTKNQTFNNNFESVNHTVLVLALQDTVVIPRESEWFGFYEDGSQTTILNMNQTAWYQQDLFGLKTAFQLNKISFTTTPGNHVEFDDQFIADMVNTYFRN